jgi:hypothetical protein
MDSLKGGSRREDCVEGGRLLWEETKSGLRLNGSPPATTSLTRTCTNHLQLVRK